MADETSYRAAHLLLHDEEFLKAHESLDPKVFPPGPLRYLADLALRQWADYHTTLTATVVDQATDAEGPIIRRAKTTPDSVIRVYLELDKYAPEEDALPYVREVCTEWLEQFALGSYVEKAGAALDRGDLEKAREALSAGLSPVAREREGVKLSEFVGKPLPKLVPGAIPTGLYELDRLWGGGVRPGELGLLLGPTNVGKSMVAVSFAARAFWKGRSVLYYTFELTPDQIMERTICAILEVGPKTLKKRIGDASPEDVWRESLDRMARQRGFAAAPTVDIDVRTGLMTVRDLIHELDEYERENGQMPGLLLLDSADELASGHKKQATWEEIRDIFTTLRGEIAHKRRLAVWTTGQATREAVDKAVISLKHVGASFAKAQRAHYVLGLAQSGKEAESDALGDPQINVYVLKDTLHGTRGGWLRCTARFGRGGDGYAGLETNEVYKLPVLMGREEDPE